MIQESKMSQSSRIKVIISAFACEADEGSEPEVGWKWAHEMGKDVDVVVLTQAKNEERISKWYRDHPEHTPRVRFEYFDLGERWIKCKKKWGWFLLPYYILWQRNVSRKVSELVRRDKIDLIHHVTFASFRYPVFLRGCPVIWGPVGGADKAPFRLIFSGGGFIGMARELLRNVATSFSALSVGILNPSSRRKGGGEVFASTKVTQEVLANAGIQSDLMPTIGVEVEEDTPPLRGAPEDGQLHFLYVGRLHHLKGIHLLLEALAQLASPSAKLSIVGDGIERGRLMRQVRRLDLEGRVEFVGAVPRLKLGKWYRDADVLVAPSLYESGGLTVLEGFRWAMPAIVLDCGGHSLSVGEGCGIRVDAHQSKKKVINGLAEAMEYYLKNPGSVVGDGVRGWERLKKVYSWEAKRERMLLSYRSLASERAATQEGEHDEEL